MLKRGVILLCCFLGACQREDASSAARQPAKNTKREHAREARAPEEREQASKAREAKIRAEELAASKDAELQNLLQETGHESDPFGGPTGPDYDAIAALYGTRYPQAGIRWLLSQASPPQTPWWNFAKAFYAANPGAAFKTLEQLPLAAREEFAMGLCQAVNAADRQRLWEMIDKGEVNFKNPAGLQGRLITNQARSDPEGAWKLAQETIGTRCEEQVFLSSLHNLEPETPYPSSHLDRITPDEWAEVVSAGLHACRSRANIEPLSRWLAAKPPSPELETIYEDIAGWEGAYGDTAKAWEWIEKITDPIRRERAIRDLPKEAVRSH